MADLTLPSVERSTKDIESSSTSTSSRRRVKARGHRYSKLSEKVKSSFIRVLKATANPFLWRHLTDKLEFNETQIKLIEKNVQENSDNSSYSPYVDIIETYEDADRSVKTLFIKLGE